MKKLSVIIIAAITIFLLSARVTAYGNITQLSDISQTQFTEENTEITTSVDLEQLYRQQNDQAVKNIMIIQFAAIGALLLILGIIFLVSYIQRQKKKKISEQRQAAYDREKKLREEEEKREREKNGNNS